MVEKFFAAYGMPLVYALVSAGLFAIIRYAIAEYKQYHKYKEEHDDKLDDKRVMEKVGEVIEDRSASQKKELDSLVAQVENLNTCLESVRSYYKFKIVDICKGHLARGLITAQDYEELTEIYRLYKGMNGNGQAESYYNKTTELPIQE